MSYGSSRYCLSFFSEVYNWRVDNFGKTIFVNHLVPSPQKSPQGIKRITTLSIFGKVWTDQTMSHIIQTCWILQCVYPCEICKKTFTNLSGTYQEITSEEFACVYKVLLVSGSGFLCLLSHLHAKHFALDQNEFDDFV